MINEKKIQRISFWNNREYYFRCKTMACSSRKVSPMFRFGKEKVRCGRGSFLQKMCEQVPVVNQNTVSAVETFAVYTSHTQDHALNIILTSFVRQCCHFLRIKLLAFTGGSLLFIYNAVLWCGRKMTKMINDFSNNSALTGQYFARKRCSFLSLNCNIN